MTDHDQEALKSLVLDADTSIEPIPTTEAPVLETLEDIRGVVFDVYGTILVSGVGDIGLTAEEDREAPLTGAITAAGLELDDSSGSLYQAFKEEISACQKSEQERRDNLEFPEVEIREVWENLLRRLNTENRLSGDITLRRIAEIALRFELAVNPVALMPGLVELMQQLRENSIPVGIISNAQFFTPVILETLFDSELKAFGIDPYTCVWSYLEREAKPSPQLYRKAAEKWQGGYGISPKNLLYIGNDMRNDIAPAHHCGFRTALFAGDQRSLRLRPDDPSTRGVKPDCVITSLSQVNDILALP